MIKGRIIFIFIVLLSFFISSHHTLAFDWYENIEMKVTILTTDIEYEWEYENPNDFEYEKGQTIIKGKKAKEEYEQLLSHLDLSNEKFDDQHILKLEEIGIKNIERVEVHLVDGEGNYKTWLWKKGT
ncbi:hypothetical protein LGQ02_15690 [Bacillus shivajii]|uniref:hypothetical protein n=1 Tax=Bacillus shivajii TaxID=1983719 RepID=UPI001CFB9C73|nr:hypothetical protein [Bacillus shivajii]UCZ52273.1 hypothetical protein LGQ02_15690 [Bacillus shivajii]